jgi:predicted dehydrogenase
MKKQTVWLVGTGPMAVEYAKVLKALEMNFITIGRGEANAQKFEQETGNKPVLGGLTAFLGTKPSFPDAVINAVGIQALSETTIQLLNAGVKKILLEKPGIGYVTEMEALLQASKKESANVVLAYNRRFYSSVLKAKEIIRQDGGVTSMQFEFTEWSHTISKLVKTDVEWNNWFLGNSTHVIDTAFFLAGRPKTLSAYVKGQKNLNWHPASSVFTGAGETINGALFSYHANWESPGRWVLELLTAKHRLIFKPMEMLQIQLIGSVQVNPVEIDDALDKQFKPGVYLQTRAFLDGDYSGFCTLAEQNENLKVYKQMSGY